MKKLLAFALILALILLPSASAVIDSQALEITIRIADEYVQPGETTTFRINFRNSGSSSMIDIRYEMLGGADISGFPAGEQILGGMIAGEYLGKDHSLSVAGISDSGTHTISVRAEYIMNGASYETQTNFGFQVGSEADLYLESVGSEQEEIEAGKTTDLIVKVRNIGETTISQIIAEFAAKNTTYIKPELAGATSYWKEMQPNQLGIFKFKIKVDPSTDLAIYEAIVTLNYKDSEGISQSEDFTIGLPVSGTPKLEVLNTKIENGDFKVEVENLGSAKAKAIKVELVQGNKVMSVDIDNELKVDKHTTLRFDAFKKGTGELRFTFLDGNDNSYNESVTVSVKGSSSSGFSGLSSFVLIIVIIGEGYYIYRLRKKSKK